MQHKINLKEFLLLDITLSFLIAISIIYYVNVLNKNEIKGNTGCDIDYIYSDHGEKLMIYDMDATKKLVWFIDETNSN